MDHKNLQYLKKSKIKQNKQIPYLSHFQQLIIFHEYFILFSFISWLLFFSPVPNITLIPVRILPYSSYKIFNPTEPIPFCYVRLLRPNIEEHCPKHTCTQTNLENTHWLGLLRYVNTHRSICNTIRTMHSYRLKACQGCTLGQVAARTHCWR